MAINIASLGIKIDPSKAVTGAKRVTSALRKITGAAGKTLRAVKSVAKSFAKFGLASLGTVTALGYLIKKSLDTTDEMIKMSRSIGVTVRQLQALRHAGSLGGLSTQQLDKAVQKLSINMSDAAKGMGLAIDIFNRYDVKATNLDGTLRSTVDVMFDFADKMQGVTNSTEKAEVAYKLFGMRGAEMINVIENGSEALREQMKEAEKLGLVMSRETAEGVEQANDAITRLTSYITSVFNRAVAELAPTIKEVTDEIREWVEMKLDNNGGIAKVARNMAIWILEAAKTIINSFQNITNAFTGMVKSVASQFGLLSRPVETVTQKIKEMQEYIAISKKHIASGGVLDNPFGWTEDTLENQKKKLKELNAELEVSKIASSAFEPVDLSDWSNGLDAQIAKMKEFNFVKNDGGNGGNGGGDALKKQLSDLEVFSTAFNTKMKTMKDETKSIWETMGTSMAEMFGEGGSISTGIGNAMSQMIVYGQSAGDTMKQLGQTIISSVLGSLIQTGVQMAINWAKEKMFTTASTVMDSTAKATQTSTAVAAITAVTGANVAAGVATAAAWAPAAAAVSLATLGANSAPAMAGITATNALSKGLSVASFEGGGFTGAGSRSGGVDGKGGFPAILHPNETVVDHDKGQGSGATVNFNITANDAQGFDQLLVKRRGMIVSMINQAMNDKGMAGIA